MAQQECLQDEELELLVLVLHSGLEHMQELGHDVVGAMNRVAAQIPEVSGLLQMR